MGVGADDGEVETDRRRLAEEEAEGKRKVLGLVFLLCVGAWFRVCRRIDRASRLTIENMYCCSWKKKRKHAFKSKVLPTAGAQELR